MRYEVRCEGMKIFRLWIVSIPAMNALRLADIDDGRQARHWRRLLVSYREIIHSEDCAGLSVMVVIILLGKKNILCCVVLCVGAWTATRDGGREW